MTASQGHGPPLDEDPEFLAALEELDPDPAFSPRPAAPPLPFLGAGPPRLPEPPVSTPSPPEAPAALAAYEVFYGLDGKAFGPSPDSQFSYRSASYERALQELIDAIARPDGLIVLVGGEGTGKTTVCRALAAALGRRTVTAIVSDGPRTAENVLRGALIEFGIASRDRAGGDGLAAAGCDELAGAVRAFAAFLAPLQASALLVVDDAHLLPDEALHRLRALPSGSGAEGRLQVLLAGEPPLESRVQRDGVGLFDEQPSATLCRLGLLAPEEIGGYLAQRLAAAGGSSRAEFSEGALRELTLRSGGVPQLVNLLCDRALARGAARSATVIDARLVAEAGRDLGLHRARSRLYSTGMRLALAIALVGLMLVGAGMAVWLFRDEVSRIVGEWQSIPPAPERPAPRRSPPLAPIPPPD